MGGRGNSAARNSSDETYKTIIEPEKGLVGGKKTEKSHKIFLRSYVAAKDFMDDVEDKDKFMLGDFYGYDSEKEVLSSQVYRGIQDEISRRLRDADLDLKLGVIDEAKYREEKQILNALQKTLNRRWQIHKS